MVMETKSEGIEDLPEGCIANVISLTSPRDACILSLVSSTFRSAAQSDVVWDRFLPSDYRSIISQSLLSSSYSKKDIYLHLCQNPLLIDAGNKSFLLDKVYGKKCYMLSPRSLSIVWGDTPRYWRWLSTPGSRFSEVAELVSVCWLEIKGWIKTCMLSPDTMYCAYLVFKQSGAGSYGFEDQPIEVSIGIAGECDARRSTVYLEAETRRRPPCQIVPRRVGIFNRIRSRLVGNLDALEQSPTPEPPPRHLGDDCRYPKKRNDGWWEIEIGEFFNKGGEDKEVEMGVYEVKSGDWKGGLILQGIELKPKPNK